MKIYMNHTYQIVTNEVDETPSGQRQFVAHLANIYIEVDGKRIEAPYPNNQVKGVTYTSAMLKANDAFQQWLNNFEDRELVTE